MPSLILSLVLWLAGSQARGQAPVRLQGPERPVEPQVTETIAGTVIHAETLRPFARVRVELRREDYGRRLNIYEKPCRPAHDIEDAQLRRFVMTDVNGRFRFDDIVPGRYYVIAEHEGYLPAVFGQREGSYSRGLVLAIGPQSEARAGLSSAQLQDLSLRLTPAPTIVGRVYNDAGARVPAAVVQLYQSRFGALDGRTLIPIRSMFADDNGEYRMFWLNPGQYVVSAAYSDYVFQPWTTGLRFTANLPDPDNRYPVVFHPGTIKASEALPVAVGQVTPPPVDLTLWERPRFDVQIRLVGATPPKDTTVVLVPYGGDMCSAMDFGFIPRKEDGVVEIRDVPAGLYMVMAMNGREAWSELRTLVVDQPIRNFPLSIVQPVDIPVMGPGEIDGKAIYVNLRRTSSEVNQVLSFGPDSKGKITLKGVGPGSYYVTVDSPYGNYLASSVAMGIDENCYMPPGTRPSVNYQYLDTHGHLNRQLPLVVRSVIPGEFRCLSISVARGGRLFGRVLDRVGAPVAGALVAGLPRGLWGAPDSKAAYVPADRYVSATTDGEGRFVLSGAARGTEYKLLAFEDLDPTLLFDPDLAGRFPNRDLIEFEPLDGGDTRAARRTQGQRSVTFQAFGPETSPCPSTILCVLRVIPADETRAYNQGR